MRPPGVGLQFLGAVTHHHRQVPKDRQAQEAVLLFRITHQQLGDYPED